MPTAIERALDKLIGPVTAEDVADFEREYGTGRGGGRGAAPADLEEAPPKKRTRGPGKKNSTFTSYLL